MLPPSCAVKSPSRSDMSSSEEVEITVPEAATVRSSAPQSQKRLEDASAAQVEPAASFRDVSIASQASPYWPDYMHAPSLTIARSFCTHPQLFTFAQTSDHLLLGVVVIGNVIAGALRPGANILFGDSFDSTTITLQDFWDRFAGFGFIGLGIAVSQSIATTACEVTQHRQVAEWKKASLRAVLRQDLGWYDVNQPQELTSRMAEALVLIEAGLSSSTFNLFNALGEWRVMTRVAVLIERRAAACLACNVRATAHRPGARGAHHRLLLPVGSCAGRSGRVPPPHLCDCPLGRHQPHDDAARAERVCGSRRRGLGGARRVAHRRLVWDGGVCGEQVRAPGQGHGRGGPTPHLAPFPPSRARRSCL